MEKIEIFQVDAFTDKVFHGNPAAVCLLHDWLNDELLQAIAVENNLSETAFIIKSDEGFLIRWFGPNGEINLCGHATLAAGFVLFQLKKYKGKSVTFSSLSGILNVSKKNDYYTLELPRLSYHPMIDSAQLEALLSQPAVEVYESELDYLILYPDEITMMRTEIDLPGLADLPKRGLIITAPGNDVDFHSRCFYPRHNISEDPVTGSAHCVLAPFWAERLNKTSLQAIQGSFRKGNIYCDVHDKHVNISGHCKLYFKGHLVI